MKALFFTLLFFGAAFAAYDYFGAPVGEKIIFTDLNKAAVVVEESAYTLPVPKADEPAREIPHIPQDMPAAAKPAETKPVADAPPPAPAGPVTDATGFTPPKYDTLETLTKGWTAIPASAFPRPVHINKAVPFKMSMGSSNMNAGAEVVALAFAQGLLQLAPTATSTARAVVALDDTDLKKVLQTGYENWQVLRTAALKSGHQRRLASKAANPVAAVATPATDPATPPERATDGSYPLLVAHLTSGEVTEVKVKNIHQWGTAETTTFEGRPAWSIKVQVDVDTVFGKQPAEVQCVVASGRVKGWFYTGSGEPVP
jgi:hypothetical protein